MKRLCLPIVLTLLASLAPASAAPRTPKASASAAAPAASASAPAPLVADAGAPERAWTSCTEHVPPGATHPALKEQFPRHATSGYATSLEVTIEHGKGETVLPQGFQTQASSAASRELAEAGFVFPEIDGGASPSLTTTPSANGATTKVAIPVLLLPKAPGRNRMTLPPVPIAIARASGELLTLCTEPHDVVVDDPTSSTPDAKPRANPEPRPQLEEWVLAKQLAIGAAVGAVVAAAVAWLAWWWSKRPRPVPPPPPPRPPWEVAFEELFAVRHAGLAREARFAEHYDRVSDAVRKYLGGRYGFDGLETTTREMTSILKRVEPPVVELTAILQFLDECDLVKFARFTPSDEDCTRVLDQGEFIVRITIPPTVVAPRSEPEPRAGTRRVDFMTGAARAALLFLFTLVVGTLAIAYPILDRQWEWLGVSWQYPKLLFLLLIVPVVFWRGTYGEDDRTPRLRVGVIAPLTSGPRGIRARLRDLPGVVRAFAILLLALAMARPVSASRPDSENESGIDIVLVLDLSGSMRAVFDAPPGAARLGSIGKRATRLDTAKEVIRDFIGRRKTDRIGVVVFGKSAFVLSPPTLDYHLLDLLVDKMSLDVIDGSATAIGDAVGVATARLRRSDARSKAIVLLTDGDSNAGSIAPEYAGHLATVVGAKIYTIQIGNGDEVEVQDGLDLFGQPHYARARYPVNPELLKKLAADTAGEAYVATDAQALTASMHDVLNRLEKTRFESSTASFEDLFPLFLLPGVALVALDALLRAWVMRRFP